jgi:acyl-CoA synthetase (NDP forming)
MAAINQDEAVRRLFEARSVAVVGASEKPGAPAGFVVRNLQACAYGGRILPVHPSAPTVFGLKAVPRLSDLDEIPDAILVGVAAERVARVLEEAGACGVKAAVVLASGFAELDAAGRGRQEELVAIAARYGMAVCGPNCLGVYNLRTGLALYSSRLSPAMRRGGLAILSHSGASAIALSNTARIGISHVVSSGNSAVTDVPEYLRYLATDDHTRLAALVLEQVRDPDSFAAAMAMMHAAGKPVIALRAGRSRKGAAATAAHTGSLAGADEAFLAFFRHTGVYAVDSMDDLIETAVLLADEGPAPTGRGVALIGVSGGGMAHVSDIAEAEGVTLPDLATATVTALREALPSYATPQNPLDVTGIVFGEPVIYERCLSALDADPAVGLIAAVQDVPVGLDDGGAEEYRGIAQAVASFRTRATKPVVFLSNVSAGPHPTVRPLLDGAGVPVLHGTRAALRAIRRAVEPAVPESVEAVPALEPQSRWIERLSTGLPLTEREAKTFLADHGVAVTRERLARTAVEAREAAAAMSGQVALKIESPDIPHKTEAGGVRLGIEPPEAEAAFEAIMVSCAEYAPDARLVGVLVQEMVVGGTEAILGLTRCEPFGLALVVGTGGILVELLRDSALGLLPLGPTQARVLLGRTKVASLLTGYRGAAPGDVDAFVELMVRFGQIACCYQDQLEAAEINPVVVLPQGQGVRVLDSLVLPRRASAFSTVIQNEGAARAP